jgi:Na+/melibiose symporter-like transporter
MRYGLGLIGLSLLLIFLTGPFASIFGEAGGLAYVLTTGSIALAGFVLLLLSIFLPQEKKEKPNFTQELLGKEKMHYGVYSRGDWITVLDEEGEKKEKSPPQ